MRALALPLALFCWATAASAADDKPGRYTMTPSGDGMVRLDTDTGEVSLCARKDGDWACQPMAENGKALRSENDRLMAENKGLKDEIKRLEETLGIDAPKLGDEGPSLAPKGKIELPSEEDMDKAFDYFEGMIKKFRDRLKKLEPPKDEGAPL